MFALSKLEPVTHELLPEREGMAAVRVTFAAQPSPLSLRRARAAVAQAWRAFDGDPDKVERCGDAFSRELIRYNILRWEGIEVDGAPVDPTHDREILDDAGKMVDVERGTISFFLDEPRLFDAADRLYVLPWSKLDAEKNGYAPSPSGTGAGAMPAPDIASSAATLPKKDGAGKKKRAPRPARTKRTSRKPTKASASGS